MKYKFYQHKGFYLSLLVALLLIFVDIITRHKSLFVPVGVNFKIADGIILILAILLVFRVKFIRELLVVSTLFYFLLTVFFIIKTDKQYLINWLWLSATVLLSFFLLKFSKEIKSFQNKSDLGTRLNQMFPWL